MRYFHHLNLDLSSVMSKFLWNKDYKDKPGKIIGKCYCNLCTGKGHGEGNGNCKKNHIRIPKW